MHNYRS